MPVFSRILIPVILTVGSFLLGWSHVGCVFLGATLTYGYFIVKSIQEDAEL
jgi:hypothetical protein